jgi:hypothetical protein
MKVIMDDLRLNTIDQIKEFLKGSRELIVRLNSIEEKYTFIDETVDRFSYGSLKKKEKRTIVKYLKKITGYKHSQLFRLIDRATIGELIRKPYKRLTDYHRKYTPYDIKLLEKTDELHLRLNAHATHEIMRREYEVFHHQEYNNVFRISVSHIDNLRKSAVYTSSWVNGTKAREIPIGITGKPVTNNHPGSIRIDTVSQRDVCHINSVDEITQWQIVICVPQISERYLLPALKILLKEYPFIIFNFHSDRGSEFINRIVAHLLNKLLIRQTKSRSRHCNDNALVEGKNGSVIRKNMGYSHINQNLVDKINHFYINYFNPYLNYHRPCGFVTEIKKDFKGRERKIYGQYTTPYEKLKEIAKQENKSFLKPGQSFEKLDIIAYGESDNEFAKKVREKHNELFELNIFFHGKS